jgi:histidyl-tRNA synthetase
MSLDTTSYKGVRDFYPEDQFIQSHITNTWRRVVERFGYAEYHASVLESAELYRAKSGEEIVNEQTYTFTDRGEREVTLRPEMTPTVARMVAAKGRELSFPLRWYSIPNLFRYERPQRGRLREHWQLNVDLFGLEGIEAEIEMITIAHHIMQEFGISEDKFEIRINDRILVKEQMEIAGLSEDEQHTYQKLLDKKDKIDDFADQVRTITDKPISTDFAPSSRITSIITNLNQRSITNVVFSPTLMRGFDYYTGIVFEVFDKHPDNNRSLFGGGRYDKLLDIFDHDPVPAIGFGMGDVTIRDVLETYELLPTYRSTTDLYICLLDKKYTSAADELARELRQSNINVAIDYTGRKIGDQIKKADRDRIPFVICIGEDEIASDIYTIKELSTGKEEKLKGKEISSYIK